MTWPPINKTAATATATVKRASRRTCSQIVVQVPRTTMVWSHGGATHHARRCRYRRESQVARAAGAGSIDKRGRVGVRHTPQIPDGVENPSRGAQGFTCRTVSTSRAREVFLVQTHGVKGVRSTPRLATLRCCSFNRPAVVAAVGVVAVRVELFRGEVLAVARGSKSSVGVRPFRPSSFVSGFLSVGCLGAELLRSGVAIFDLDYDAILAAMYALSISAEGGCYLCVPPDPGIEATALGASESALPGTAPAKALHTFTLDSGASRCFFRDSTTLTPLSAPVPVRLADPSGDPVLTRSSTVLPCPTVPSGSLSGLHLPSFSTNLVSTTALQDAMVITTTLGGQRVSICTCTRTGHHLATFTCRPGSNLYTLGTEPPQVVASA
ncbi:unnamed protein product [Closterium sp. NIES-54]